MQLGPDPDREPLFEEVVRKYEREIFRLILRQVEDAEIAEDLTQESFLAAYREFELRPADVEMRTWLCRYALRQTQNYFRSARNNAPPEDGASE